MGQPDGTKIRNLSPLRRFMPFMMPRRNESVVYFDQRLRVDRCLRWIEARDDGTTFFEVVLAALARTIEERPQLNRFVAHGAVYQRHAVEISFAVKKTMTDAGGLTTVKVPFPKGATLPTLRDGIEDAISAGRSEVEQTSEREMRGITRLPGFLIRALLAAHRTLERLGLLPAVLIRTDPLYASVFVANLGSVGLDAAYHHLYEQGTVPIFAVVGRIQKAPVVDVDDRVIAAQVADVRFSYDERIADGFYAARSLERFKAYVEDPEQLLTRPE